jgi:hypothetical protein
MMDELLYVARKKKSGGWQVLWPCELGGMLILAGVKQGEDGCPYRGLSLVGQRIIHLGDLEQVIDEDGEIRFSEAGYFRDKTVIRDPGAFLQEIRSKPPKKAALALMEGANELAQMEGMVSEMERLWRELRIEFRAP